MECKEPSPGLINTLGNKVRWEVVFQVLILKGIMELGIWHGPAIEPYIDQVGFT